MRRVLTRHRSGFSGLAEPVAEAGARGLTFFIREEGAPNVDKGLSPRPPATAAVCGPCTVPAAATGHHRNRPETWHRAATEIRDVAGWLLRNPDTLDTHDQQRLTGLRTQCPHLDRLADHVTSFAKMTAFIALLRVGATTRSGRGWESPGARAGSRRRNSLVSTHGNR
jgi:hypothetical protein